MLRRLPSAGGAHFVGGAGFPLKKGALRGGTCATARRIFQFCTGFVLSLFTVSAVALTVRVESPGGAPRIVVDGQPVRARMFWGGPGWSALAVGAEWKAHDFEFTATGGAAHGTMHFRFDPSQGEAWVDDIRVVDLTAGGDLIPLTDFEGGRAAFDRDWRCWPTDHTNTVGTITVEPGAGHGGNGGLHVRLAAPPDGVWPDFHLHHRANLRLTAGHRYRVTFWAKASATRMIQIGFYDPEKSYAQIGGPLDPFPAQVRLAADAGVNFVSFPVPLPWPKPGEPDDWREVDAVCASVLAANPQALLIPRVPMNPPDWWRAAHPDDVMQWEDGTRRLMVVASPAYRRDASARLVAFISHVEAKFGDRVAGYHPAGQNTDEWFYEGSWERPLSGYAPADLAAWQRWLKVCYQTDAALRAAWHDPAASFERAAVPGAGARHASPAGVFRDPEKEQPVIDWARFQQDAMAECVCELARSARTASHGRKLVLFFYGYVHELAALPNGPAVSGHYRLRRVLDCPEIDVLCSPISYFDRGLGGSAPAMSAAESVALAGKLWLNEDDTRTSVATGIMPGFKDRVETVAETDAELTRNTAQAGLRNFGTWWMDLTRTGWFNDAALWTRMKSLAVLDDALLRMPTPYHPEIAAVLDESAMELVTPEGHSVSRECAYTVRQMLGRSGAPYGQYLLDDVLAGRVQAKLYVFLNAWSLTAAQREKLREATRGSLCVWCYAPGWFDGGQPSLAAMEQLTGFRLQQLDGLSGWAVPTPGAGLTEPFGRNKPVRPLFGLRDAADGETLATYANGHTAVALRKTSLFVGAPGLTSELVRFAARRAGVHLYADVDCNVTANGNFILLHAVKDGPVPIHTGRPGPVTDALSGTALGEGPRLTLPMKFGETRVLKLAP